VLCGWTFRDDELAFWRGCLAGSPLEHCMPQKRIAKHAAKTKNLEEKVTSPASLGKKRSWDGHHDQRAAAADTLGGPTRKGRMGQEAVLIVLDREEAERKVMFRTEKAGGDRLFWDGRRNMIE